MKLFEHYIKKYTSKIKPIVFESVDSTNSVARDLAKSGAKEGTAVIAFKQTAGRGRLGRQFFSPDGGVYISLILRPDILPQDTLFITVAAAVAAVRGIEKISDQKCLIKWVNDIYIDNKKVCGILTEGEFSNENRLDFAVLGVGINLFEPKGGYPKDLPLATSVLKTAFNKSKLKAKLIAEFANAFFDFYSKLQNKEYINEYRKRSFLTGKNITYQKNGEMHNATVLGIDDNARLVVKNADEVETLSTGEVQIYKF